MDSEVVVGKRGRITIPSKLRQKLGIEGGTRLEVVEAHEGILLKPKKSIWDMIGSGAKSATVEEMKEELDKLREEDS